jgi:hypothetical protein
MLASPRSPVSDNGARVVRDQAAEHGVGVMDVAQVPIRHVRQRGQSRCLPGHVGRTAHSSLREKTDMRSETAASTISNQTSECLTD